jgi:hypothetical protein
MLRYEFASLKDNIPDVLKSCCHRARILTCSWHESKTPSARWRSHFIGYFFHWLSVQLTKNNRSDSTRACSGSSDCCHTRAGSGRRRARRHTHTGDRSDGDSHQGRSVNLAYEQ